MDALQLPDLMKTTKNKSKWRKLANNVGTSKTTLGPEFNGMPPELPTPRKETHSHQTHHFPNATAASACHQLLNNDEEDGRRLAKQRVRKHAMRTRSMTTTATNNQHKTPKQVTLSASAPNFKPTPPPLVLKQAKIKKKKPKPTKLTYEEKVAEYKDYLYLGTSRSIQTSSGRGI